MDSSHSRPLSGNLSETHNGFMQFLDLANEPFIWWNWCSCVNYFTNRNSWMKGKIKHVLYWTIKWTAMSMRTTNLGFHCKTTFFATRVSWRWKASTAFAFFKNVIVSLYIFKIHCTYWMYFVHIAYNREKENILTQISYIFFL